jgi:hypothetical protein
MRNVEINVIEVPNINSNFIFFHFMFSAILCTSCMVPVKCPQEQYFSDVMPLLQAPQKP